MGNFYVCTIYSFTYLIEGVVTDIADLLPGALNGDNNGLSLLLDAGQRKEKDS